MHLYMWVLMPPLSVFHESSSGHQASMRDTFAHWTISLAPKSFLISLPDHKQVTTLLSDWKLPTSAHADDIKRLYL